VAEIGRDLLDVPFAEMVRNLAVAIADGQAALDRNSLDTLRELVNTNVDVITDITEVITPDPFDVDVPAVGTTPAQTIQVTGARVIASGSPGVPMSMFQAGLSPTFYQFTEATIEVRLSITVREDRRENTSGRSSESASPAGGFLRLGASRAYASSVDYRSAATFNYEARGASVLRATMRPVPPPSRLQPSVTTVNAIAQPPAVFRSPG
jgi:hypothetical protein